MKKIALIMLLILNFGLYSQPNNIYEFYITKAVQLQLIKIQTDALEDTELRNYFNQEIPTILEEMHFILTDATSAPNTKDQYIYQEQIETSIAHRIELLLPDNINFNPTNPNNNVVSKSEYRSLSLYF